MRRRLRVVPSLTEPRYWANFRQGRRRRRGRWLQIFKFETHCDLISIIQYVVVNFRVQILSNLFNMLILFKFVENGFSPPHFRRLCLRGSTGLAQPETAITEPVWAFLGLLCVVSRRAGRFRRRCPPLHEEQMSMRPRRLDHVTSFTAELPHSLSCRKGSGTALEAFSGSTSVRDSLRNRHDTENPKGLGRQNHPRPKSLVYAGSVRLCRRRAFTLIVLLGLRRCFVLRLGVRFHSLRAFRGGSVLIGTASIGSLSSCVLLSLLGLLALPAISFFPRLGFVEDVLLFLKLRIRHELRAGGIPTQLTVLIRGDIVTNREMRLRNDAEIFSTKAARSLFTFKSGHRVHLEVCLSVTVPRVLVVGRATVVITNYGVAHSDISLRLCQAFHHFRGKMNLIIDGKSRMQFHNRPNDRNVVIHFCDSSCKKFTRLCPARY
ncbi:hypothetical protein NY78_1854 [Desulfovibrio sp. TomC]|nr:hypothetical protein NY78_1854 [Desulfovibrio sp. TomC]